MKVLDKGYVKLVDHMGKDCTVVMAARASHDEGLKSPEEDESLAKYLYKNRHTSPFEHTALQFEVKAPIFVTRQWMRHRTWSFNEISGRYAEIPSDFYIPDIDSVGVQSASSKQASDLVHNPNAKYFRYFLILFVNCATVFYKTALRMGIPKEKARMFLPLNIYTKFYATVDLHNFIRFLQLRLHDHAQYEIRVYALAMLNQAMEFFPQSLTNVIEELYRLEGYQWFTSSMEFDYEK